MKLLMERNVSATVNTSFGMTVVVIVVAAVVVVLVVVSKVVVVVAVFTLILTAVGRVGRRSVQEAGGCRHSEVWHAGVAVAVHAVADCVAIVTLLGGGAWHISPRRHAARVTTVTNWKRTTSQV